MSESPKKKQNWWLIALLLPLTPVFLVIAIGYAVFYFLSSLSLHVAIWLFWCRQGSKVMFVYSDSPTSKQYIQNNVLSALPKDSIVLNWSGRSTWASSFTRMVFFHFGGRRNYCPIGIVFRPFKRTRIFRFWKPFLDFKHGKPANVIKLTNEFLSAVKHVQ